MKTCSKCLKKYHRRCFLLDKSRPSIHICHVCEEKYKLEIKKTCISEYFKPLNSESLSSDGVIVNACSNGNKKIKKGRRRKRISFSADRLRLKNGTSDYYLYNNSGRLKSFKELSPRRNNRLKECLMKALILKGYKFSDDLVYLEVNQQANDASKEPGVMQISEYNKKIYYHVKTKTRLGNYPGLEVVRDEKQGLIVNASEDIPMNTLLCEYSGEVTSLRKVFFDESNDSIMELIKAPSSVDSLVIRPQKYANIARFISGVNNHKQESMKKVNVYSAKVNIDGKVRILLYASRNIRKGETLYYDYNRGGYDYPTNHFV